MTRQILTHVVIFLLLASSLCAHCAGLYQSTQLFDRLKYHEIITINNHQFHDIDNTHIPPTFYPTNGTLEFDAFGRKYTLLLNKNTQLFPDNFYTEIHTFNKQSGLIEKIRSHKLHRCYYNAEVLSDFSDNPTNAVLSLCHGRGIRGWIHAFGETVVIRPKLYLTNVTYKGAHQINDEHIIYKYSDLDRTDWSSQKGQGIKRFDFGAIANEIRAHSNNNENVLNLPIQRRLQSDNQSYLTRFVELAIVNDPAMLTRYDSDLEVLLDKTISIVAGVQSLYLNTDWGPTVGEIKFVLTAVYFIDSWDSSVYEPDTIQIDGCTSSIPSIYSSAPSADYCEVGYGDYLNKFRQYRINVLDYADNAQLFSFYDFGGSVIGYSSLPGMCIASQSEGINQVVYDDEYESLQVAHELGHNFNMQHDGTGNSCDPAEYIMASVGSPYGNRATEFSECSIQFMENFFAAYPSVLECLNNKPSESEYGHCGNGVVDQGEDCDCGSNDCSSTDYCCDGSICALHAFAECSNLDQCCNTCLLRSNDWICRPLNEYNSCDIGAEYCDGISPLCAEDTFDIEGTVCQSMNGFNGYCYSGACVSIDDQCEMYDQNYTVSNNNYCNFTSVWQISYAECSSSVLKCESGIGCIDISEAPNDGMPCNKSDSVPWQCLNGECVQSSSMYTYSWRTNAWGNCTIDCKYSEGDSAGHQTRTIDCTLQNGVIESNQSLCTASEEPISVRLCNDYLCNVTIAPASTLSGEGSEEIKIKIDKGSFFFKMLFVTWAVQGLIVLYSFGYIFCFSQLLKRSQEPGTASIFSTLRALGVCKCIGLVLEIFDIGTDYLYAVELITSDSEDLINLGWVSLFSAIIGLILFGVKTILTNKLIGYQECKLKKELKKLPTNSPKAKDVMIDIRKRHIDLATIGLLISCFEDIPQATIVVIVVRSSQVWDAISVLNFALAVISFLWKCVQVLASKMGCNDPSDVLRLKSKAELELADNTAAEQKAAEQVQTKNTV